MHPQGASFDRDAAARECTDLWADIDADPSTLRMLAKRGHVAITDGELWQHELPESERAYLGRLLWADGQSRPVELRLVEDADANWSGLRELVAHPDPVVTELAVTAIALANWRSSQRHCPACGQPLEARSGGWVLGCVDCGTQVWPRTDPAIIVLIEDAEGRVLLGSNATWEHNRYSLLAGFVEPGESLEAAVVREIAEESGVLVTHPQYVGSQAWPFPQSLMLGFRAQAASVDVTPDGEEILDLRWFDRESILTADILLPRRGSLARRMLEDWFGGSIERHE